MNKEIFQEGTVWEEAVGYSRAVRVGNHIEVSGTTANINGQVQFKQDVYHQTTFILEKIESSLLKMGGTLNDVVRTRIYVIDISQWEQVAKAHGEFFGSIKPATSMVQVAALIDPDLLVEIEASANVNES